MALSMNFSVNFVVFIFVISCAQRHIYASKDEGYTIHGTSSLSSFDISVIEKEDSGRFRRQTNDNDTSSGSSPMATTQAPQSANPTTPFNILDNNLLHVDHVYYNSFIMKAGFDSWWIDLDVTKHDILSDSHRTAVTQQLPFRFPFYGHLISNVTIATGGFLYMSPFIHKFLTATQYIAPLMANFETKSGGTQSRVLYTKIGFLYMSPFIHQWLTATQYIAPLMANFDLALGNSSEILIASLGEKFVVEWRDVHLQDQNTTGTFQFQAILHTNGSIFFLYKKVPIPITNISSKAHPVKIGLSDAFYFDTVSLGTRRRTIYEYHRVSLNMSVIDQGTVIMIHPKPTCNTYQDCETCVSSNIGFQCQWCGIINRCSDSIDWHRQEWINSGCVQLSVNSSELCQALPTTSNYTASSTANSTTPSRATQTTVFTTRKTKIITSAPCLGASDSSCTSRETTTPIICKGAGSANCSLIPTAKPQTATEDDKGTTIAVAIIISILVIVLIGIFVGWIVYAYTHPTTASGMWLMEHRPSQMKAKLSTMKFWKRNGTAGDKYAVESSA